MSIVNCFSCSRDTLITLVLGYLYFLPLLLFPRNRKHVRYGCTVSRSSSSVIPEVPPWQTAVGSEWQLAVAERRTHFRCRKCRRCRQTSSLAGKYTHRTYITCQSNFIFTPEQVGNRGLRRANNSIWPGFQRFRHGPQCSNVFWQFDKSCIDICWRLSNMYTTHYRTPALPHSHTNWHVTPPASRMWGRHSYRIEAKASKSSGAPKQNAKLNQHQTRGTVTVTVTATATATGKATIM